MSEQQAQPVFSIEKLYVKDLSLEVPHAPQIFLEQGEPNVEMRVATQSEKLEDNFCALVQAIIKAKPAAAKGKYLRSVTVASTMGPGVRVDASQAQSMQNYSE